MKTLPAYLRNLSYAELKALALQAHKNPAKTERHVKKVLRARRRAAPTHKA